MPAPESMPPGARFGGVRAAVVDGPLVPATETPSPHPYGRCAVIGLGGLFAGATGPLLSAFVPVIVRNALGDRPAAIGGVMAMDNVLLLLLVPWTGVISDRAIGNGRGRLPLVLGGFGLAAVGMALLAGAGEWGGAAVIFSMLLLYGGINAQRTPFQALLADIVPSPSRSLANASVTFQMCVGAVVFLQLGQVWGMKNAFLAAAGAVVGIGLVFAATLPRDAPAAADGADDVSYGALAAAAWAAVRGVEPGLRATFAAALMLQLIFQSFTTWFALHGTERFGTPPEGVTGGFIAWALGGVVGALPGGFVGTRFGRRRAMLIGFGLMGLSLVAVDRAANLNQMIPWLALASASWTFPTVNIYPLFIERIAPHRRGMLAALFLLAMALGGAIGDPMNGAIFDRVESYRGLFLLMAAYTAAAFVAALAIPAERRLPRLAAGDSAGNGRAGGPNDAE